MATVDQPIIFTTALEQSDQGHSQTCRRANHPGQAFRLAEC
jgi:hypothetical protein